MKSAKVFLLAAALLLAIPSALAQHDVHAAIIAKANRKPAPVFHLDDTNGNPIQPANYRGKVILLNFWATTCGGCVLEMPWFMELQRQYQSSGFTAVGVAMDISYDNLKSTSESLARVKPYIAKHNVNYPILIGDAGMEKLYNIQAYPASFLLDKNGRVAAIYVGVVSKENLEQNIQALLKE